MLVVGEVIELSEGPKEEKIGLVMRVKGRVVADGRIGWLSMKSSNLKPWSPQCKCVVHTIAMHDALDVGTANSVRKMMLEKKRKLVFRGPVSNEVICFISVIPSNLIFMLFPTMVEIYVSKSNAYVDALEHLPMLDEFVCAIAVDCIPEEYNGVSLTDYCADSLGPILLCQPVVRSGHGSDICSQFGRRCRCSWFSSHAFWF